MILTTLLTLVNRNEQKLTFAGQGKTYVFWINKYTTLPVELTIGKQYVIKISAKKDVDSINSVIFLLSIEKTDKVYEAIYEGKAKVTGTVSNIISWNKEADDSDLPFLNRNFSTQKITITNGKTDLTLYNFSSQNKLEKGKKYSFLINLFMSRAYTDKGEEAEGDKYTFISESGDILAKMFNEFKIVSAKELSNQ